MNKINIVNFIRGWDNRADFDLKEPVIRQAELAEKYNLPVTFLFQFDAMIKTDYVEPVENCKAKKEIGLWLEISEPLILAAGLIWRGRDGFKWDWHSCVDMTVGYTLRERKLIIDKAFKKFNEIFGYYPKTVGSWALDAYSINYMKEKYNIKAALICKEQWGTDGYSLWGGYYSGGYYSCKNNILCPAQNEEQQIDVPVFRMLGCDPVDQYMNGLGTEYQGVESMEPVYGCSGSDAEWVKWFLKETFRKENLGLNYCQAGQENSFGWEAMKDGYSMQMQLFEQKRNLGEIDFELVSETAAAYMKSFKLTPCTTVEAHKENSSTLWFNSRFYRSNLYIHDKKIFLRDIFVFNENYRERYFDEVAENENLYFDNLPVIDCFRWSDKEKIGGGFFEKNSKQAAVIKDFSVQKKGGSSVCVMLELDEGIMKITYNERSIIFDFPSEGYILNAGIYKGENPVKGFADGKMLCEYRGFCYSPVLLGAVCQINESGYSIVSGGKSFEIRF